MGDCSIGLHGAVHIIVITWCGQRRGWWCWWLYRWVYRMSLQRWEVCCIHAKVGNKHVNCCNIELDSSLKFESDSSVSSSGLATISRAEAMGYCLLEEAPKEEWEADSCFNNLTKVRRLRTCRGRMNSSLGAQTTPAQEHNSVIKKGPDIPILSLRMVCKMEH
ncbi:hypothetical protein PanWU01x14_338470 [Parasponia andersonii]|uniref:Uncharacterized protein n=1 Tax=Parasponia andersonii TaxID=3476 RepID=A0A2P5AF48_PARAD|nr:hypothetical protein PanWU01x14_338470 [Parasponia andersonii]